MSDEPLPRPLVERIEQQVAENSGGKVYPGTRRYIKIYQADFAELLTLRASSPPRPTEEQVERVARAICNGWGENFDAIHRDKKHWTETHGAGPGGRFRDVNEPRQDDFSIQYNFFWEQPPACPPPPPAHNSNDVTCSPNGGFLVNLFTSANDYVQLMVKNSDPGGTMVLNPAATVSAMTFQEFSVA